MSVLHEIDDNDEVKAIVIPGFSPKAAELKIVLLGETSFKVHHTQREALEVL